MARRSQTQGRCTCGRLCDDRRKRCWRCHRKAERLAQNPPNLTTEDTSADWRELLTEPLGGSGSECAAWRTM